MKKALLLMILSLYLVGAFAQERLVKDLDNDKINDTAFVDMQHATVVCKLSSQKFRKMESKPIGDLNDQAGIKGTKNGFEFYNNWMRAGYRNQFRYDAKSSKMQLIGMSRYEFGNAANDGSGESSVNLITNDYLGDWNFYNEKKQELTKIPTIKTKMIIAKTFLENFSDETYSKYADRCADLYQRHKNAMLKAKK